MKPEFKKANNDQQLISNIRGIKNKKLYDIADIEAKIEELTEDGNCLF